MKLLALDFDGVICESAREAFLVSLRAYLEMSPDSRLAAADRDVLYEAFLGLIPLGNRAEDYGTALAAIDEGVELPDQEAYDRFRRLRDHRWIDAYHRLFYEVRSAFSSEDPDGWLRLNPPYRPFVDLLRRRAGEVAYAIATSKDRRSVRMLLEFYAVDDLFPEERILDKETGPNKAAHLEQLRRAAHVPFPEITFVDDKVHHLDAVSPLGVRAVLAGWGYNRPRERELAVRRGYLVCTLNDAESTLFDARPPVPPP